MKTSIADLIDNVLNNVTIINPNSGPAVILGEPQKINRSSFIQQILQDNTNKELRDIKNNLRRDLESLNQFIVMSGL